MTQRTPFESRRSHGAAAVIWLAALFYYSLKGLGIGFLRVDDADYFDVPFLLVGISPVFVYLLAAVIYALFATLSWDTTPVILGIRRMFYVHIGWFSLCLLFWLACFYLPPRSTFAEFIKPSIESFDKQSANMMFTAFPFTLLAILIYSALLEKPEPLGHSNVQP